MLLNNLLHDSDILEGRRLPLVFSGHHAGLLVPFHSRFGLCHPKGLSPLPPVSAIISRRHVVGTKPDCNGLIDDNSVGSSFYLEGLLADIARVTHAYVAVPDWD